MTRTLIATLTGPALTAKVYRDREWDEFIVTTSGNGKEGYHTDDREDAIATACTIAFPAATGWSGVVKRNLCNDTIEGITPYARQFFANPASC